MKQLMLAFTVGSFALATPYAQQHDHQAPAKATAARPAPAAQKAAAPQEVFCATMKTGLLCTYGTADALGLTAAKRAAWLAAVNNYNKAINEATVALQAEGKRTLSATQMAEVDRWFAAGLNPQINQLLAAPGNARGAK